MTTWYDVDWKSAFRDHFPKLIPSSRIKEVCKVKLPDNFVATKWGCYFSWDQFFFLDIMDEKKNLHMEKIKVNVETGSVKRLGTGKLSNILYRSGKLWEPRGKHWFNLLTSQPGELPERMTMEYLGEKYTEVSPSNNNKRTFITWSSDKGDCITTSGNPSSPKIDHWPEGSKLPVGYVGTTPVFSSLPWWEFRKSISVGLNVVRFARTGVISVEVGSRSFDLAVPVARSLRSITVWKGKIYFLATRDGELYLLEAVND